MLDPHAESCALDERPWWCHWEVAVLVLIVLGVYFTRISAAPVCGEESRWANAAREMITSGDWVVPRQQGTIFPERPPLGSWAMAAVGLVSGDVDLVAVRLPSALATLAIVLIIYFYAGLWMSRHAAFAAAASYATFGQVMQIGRLGESEALFTLFVGGSLLLWHACYLTQRSPQLAWTLGYSLAALGALVKGPQAPIYFVSVSCIFLIVQRDWRWLVCRAHLLGIVTFAALVGAWFVPFALNNWHAVDDIWAGLAQDRFTLDGLLKHVASYPIETFGCLLPWSPLLLGFLNPRVRRQIWSERPAMKFLVVALLVTYPSVWFAAGARGRYYMPLYPCLAVLIGLMIEHCTAKLASHGDRMFWRHFQRVSAITMGVVGSAIVVASSVPWQPLAQLSQSATFLWLWVPGVALAAGAMVWASRSESLPRPQIAVMTFCAFLALAHAGLLINLRLRGANDLEPTVAELKDRVVRGELVSLGRVYHRFAFVYDEPIRQVDWPLEAGDVPDDVEYFCFDRRPGDTPESRSGSDGRVPTSTPGTLPFAWEEVAEIPCDPVQRDVHNRSVVIGRRRRPQVAATSAPETRMR